MTNNKPYTYQTRAAELEKINEKVRQRIEEKRGSVAVLKSLNESGVHDLAIKTLESSISKSEERIAKTNQSIEKFKEKIANGHS